MNQFILSNEADQELDDIWEYIARDDVDSADRWDARLREAFSLLARNPQIGHKRQEIGGDAVLFWPVGKYLIIYRPRGDDIEILAVTQGARDIPTFLRRHS